MNEILKCPNCKREDPTVLLDQAGDPYVCDDCWNEGEEVNE